VNDTTTNLMWVALPYAALAIFIVGHLWRYRTAQYTWTTRSSQLLERRWLRVGSLSFHLGMLLVVGGHIGGLVIPKSWTERVGVSEHMYHGAAVVLGTAAGVLMCTGLLILVLRRAGNARVRAASIGRDYLAAAALLIVAFTGMYNTIGHQLLGTSYDYRETVSPWFRGIFMLQPDPTLIADAPLSFRLHAAFAFVLFAIWPFTRLVHAWSVPIAYLVRPYIVFRRRDSVAR
jgi:nitrate reductase gamma subunit